MCYGIFKTNFRNRKEYQSHVSTSRKLQKIAGLIQLNRYEESENKEGSDNYKVKKN